MLPVTGEVHLSVCRILIQNKYLQNLLRLSGGSYWLLTVSRDQRFWTIVGCGLQPLCSLQKYLTSCLCNVWILTKQSCTFTLQAPLTFPLQISWQGVAGIRRRAAGRCRRCLPDQGKPTAARDTHLGLKVLTPSACSKEPDASERLICDVLVLPSLQVWTPDPQLQVVLRWEALCRGEEVRVGPRPRDGRAHHPLHRDQGGGVHRQNDHQSHLRASGLHLTAEGQDGAQAEPRTDRSTQGHIPERWKSEFPTSCAF